MQTYDLVYFPMFLVAMLDGAETSLCRGVVHHMCMFDEFEQTNNSFVTESSHIFTLFILP